MVATQTSMQSGGNSGFDQPPVKTAIPGDGEEGFSGDEYAELLDGWESPRRKIARQGLGYLGIRSAFEEKRSIFDGAIDRQLPATLPLHLGDYNHNPNFRYN